MPSPKAMAKFKAGVNKPKKLAPVVVLPVFMDTEPSEIAEILGRADLEKRLKLLKVTRAFKGLLGEFKSRPDEGYVLCGMGRKSSFNPAKSGTLFRTLGKFMLKHEGIAFTVVFPKFWTDVIDAYNAVGDEQRIFNGLNWEAARAAAPVKKKTKARKKTGKITDSGESGDEPAVYPDYLGPFSTEELISQCVHCTLIGMETMDLFKKVREVRKALSKPLDVGIVAESLSNPVLKKAITRGQLIGEMVNGARYVGSLPGNFFHPTQAVTYVRALAKKYPMKVTVFDEKKLEAMGCGGIVAVGKGSRNPPRMVAMEYKPKTNKAKKKILLVGKGVTFDTGGISLKPGAAMHEMKYDMCGAGVVIHVMGLIAARNLPIEVTGVIGLAENMPDGAAVKPGDVYTAYNGLTVEIQNTDAEGRLVLGDVLSYAAEKYKPDYIIDFATLTGACVIALGHESSGVMTSSEELAARIDLASRKSMDKSWRLPHWRDYGLELKSDVADMRNIGGRAGGTLSANRFLSRFVPNDIPWAHVDIAGTGWRGKPGGTQSSGATGWGVRMMNQLLEDMLDGQKF